MVVAALVLHGLVAAMAALALVVAAALCCLLQPVPVARWGVASRLAVAPVTGRAAPKLMSGADGGECDDEDSPDPYAVLEIPRSATLSEIRRAYRRRAREVHPDAGGTVEDFDRLTSAFSALAGTKGRDRPVWDASEMRRRARERAASSWSELCTRAKSYSTGAAASGDSRVGMDERLPGWGAAAAESSERRRSRSREVECDEMAVQAFVDGEQAPAETVALSGQLDDAERKLAELTNREVRDAAIGHRAHEGRPGAGEYGARFYLA